MSLPSWYFSETFYRIHSNYIVNIHVRRKSEKLNLFRKKVHYKKAPLDKSISNKDVWTKTSCLQSVTLHIGFVHSSQIKMIKGMWCPFELNFGQPIPKTKAIITNADKTHKNYPIFKIFTKI